MSFRILVTGFEPFNGGRLNPSQEIVRTIAQRSYDGVELSTAVLPVEYENAWPALSAAIAESKPNAVICLGQAEGRRTISFEKIALNLDDARIADNAGVLRTQQPIDPQGPASIESTLPIEQLVFEINSLVIPAEVSMSAGTFLCNHVFYRIQQEFAESSVVSGFVHVPLMTEQAEDFDDLPTMPLEYMVTAVEKMITVLSQD